MASMKNTANAILILVAVWLTSVTGVLQSDGVLPVNYPLVP
jgi:hypothetical protein